MARFLRTICLAAAPILVLGALPAAAQFNPFEAIFGSPPRPPGSVPGGRQQPGPPPPQQQAYPQYPDQRDPRYQDPRYQDPRYQDPRYQDPRYQDPRYQDPRYQDPRSQDPRYQDPRYPDAQYPDQPRQAPPGAAGIQSQPLPPPPGGTTAAVPPGQPLPAAVPPGQPLPAAAPPPGQPLPAAVPPGQPLQAAVPGGRPRQPGDTSPQPGDEVIVEPPSQKIVNKGALFSGLDKITGRIINFDVAIGETVQFGALQVTPRICYTRPPTETSNTDAFIEVDEVTLQGEVKRIFTGWMFASSPGLHAVEHPIYDVWLTDCKNPVVAAAPVEPAAPAQPARPPAAPKQRPQQQQQTPPGTVPRR
jgi:hypothetical protein